MIEAIVISAVIVVVIIIIACGVDITVDDWGTSILTTILGLGMFFVLVMVVYALMGGK